MVRRTVFVWVGIPLLVAVAASVSHSWFRSVYMLLKGRPVLEFTHLIDLGAQETGKVAVAPLAMANRGSAELVINRVSSTCSCTGLERQDGEGFVGVNELRLAPGEEAKLRVRIAVTGSPGKSYRYAITFQTNDPDVPDGRLEVLIPRLRGGVETTPRSLVFGTVLVGQEALQVLDVRDPDPESRSVERVTSSLPDRLSTRWLPVSGITGSASEADRPVGRVEVSLLTTTPGPINGTVDIHLPGRQPTRIPVVGRIAPLVEVSPPVLVLPRVTDTGCLYHASCLVRSNEKLPLTISPGKSDKGLNVLVSSVEDNPHLQSVRIGCEPSDKKDGASPARRMAHLTARVGGRELTIEIPVDCTR